MSTLDIAVSAVRAADDRVPDVALVLGSGLGAFADQLGDPVRVPFTEIPGFAQSSVAGHAGQLVIGTVEGHTCIVLQGRLHLYEGHDAADVALPARLMLELGATTLIVTNAAGGIAASVRPGDLMLIEDHINLTGRNPLVGPVQPAEERFPDMTVAYDQALRGIAARTAVVEDVQLVRGVYAAVLGPSYETPAEIRMLAQLGAHAVGMSTVPEVIVARARGVPVLGISLITNVAAGIGQATLSHTEVLDAGAAAAERFTRLLRGIIRRLP